jgi:Sulfotransferase family
MKHEWLPNFLGIGGTRCGSTWLHFNLRKHPDVWLPPIKELHYFDRSLDYPSPSHLATERLWGRLIGREPHHRDWRRRAFRVIARCFSRQPSTLPWKLKYFIGRYDDRWYASLFEPGRDKIRGEITPSYSILTAPDVARVHALMPQAKIILLLRNPIDRIWSGCRKKFITVSEIRQRLDMPGLDVRSNYLSILSNWGHAYPKEQMLVEFYDEIESNPEALLKRVYRFLGADDADKYIWPGVRKRLNASPPLAMPPDLKLALARKYDAQLERLSALLGGHATRWLDDARAVLRSSGPAGKAA